MARIIESLDDIAEGLAVLTAADARMRRIHRIAGDPPLRRAEAGFSGLVRIVVSQQVSVASAEAIWRRTSSVFAPLTHEAILAAPDEAFREAGLSRNKTRTFRAIAAAIGEGLDLAGLAQGDADAAREILMAISGIGPWTADIYVLSCLGRADAWPTGDLALQASAADLFGLERRPDARAMLALAQDWRPWRSVAARLLWAHYRSLKGLPQAVS